MLSGQGRGVVAIATIILLTLAQGQPAGAAQYNLPSPSRYGGSYVPPGKQGYYPTGEQNVDCRNAAPLEHYRKTVSHWIDQLTELLKAATQERDAAKADYEKDYQDFYAAAAKKPPDRTAEEDAKKRYDKDRAAFENDDQLVTYYEKALQYLQGELKRTVRNYHESCGCVYDCDLDFWKCPGGRLLPPSPLIIRRKSGDSAGNPDAQRTINIVVDDTQSGGRRGLSRSEVRAALI